MSPRNLQILAIVFGVIGLLLGGLGAITAYNAKQSVRSDSELNADVRSAFEAEQAKQDELERRQASDAEKFVAELSAGKKALVKRIQSNSASIRKLRRQTRNIARQTRTLANRDRGLTGELAAVESDLGNRINRVNGRVNRVNRRVNDQQRQLARIRGFVSP